MNKTILITLWLLAALTVSAQPVNFVVGDGMTDSPLKDKVNSNISLLLTEINAAYLTSRALDLSTVSISDGASRSLAMLWRNSPFYCDDRQVVERILQTYDQGYQLRNIPIEMTDPSGKEVYLELVIGMNADGVITSVNFAIESQLYRKVMASASDERDLRHRQQIFDYLEQYRTSYNRKDLYFLELFGCDDALIINGTVIKKYVRDQVFVLKDGINYRKDVQTDILNNLRRVIAQSKYIQVHISDVQVTRHPTREGFYGVWVKQAYETPTSSDEGAIFMIWDFNVETRPQIHVRIWQPDETPVINFDSFTIK